MMDAGLSKVSGLCEMCGWPRLHEVALGLVGPGVMGENGSWVGSHTREKSEKWGEALRAATLQLQKSCVLIRFDCESGLVCRGCVENILGMFVVPSGGSDGPS